MWSRTAGFRTVIIGASHHERERLTTGDAIEDLSALHEVVNRTIDLFISKSAAVLAISHAQFPFVVQDQITRVSVARLSRNKSYRQTGTKMRLAPRAEQ